MMKGLQFLVCFVLYCDACCVINLVSSCMFDLLLFVFECQSSLDFTEL